MRCREYSGVTRCVIIGLAALMALPACSGANSDRLSFDGQFFRARLNDTDARHKFVVAVSPVSASLAGAREAGRYEAVVYCVNNYGSSDIDWVIDPDAPEEDLAIANDILTLEGACPE